MPESKPAHQRQRRNKTSTHATLVRDHNVEIPPLPKRDDEKQWNELTRQWWHDIWSSPMAPEFEKRSDIYGLILLASLIDDFWSLPYERVKTRTEVAAEIRLQEQRFGLSPMDRRKLQWQVEATDEKQDQGRRRRARTIETVDPADDPRAVLESSAS